VNENKWDCSSGSLFDAPLNQFGSLTNAAHLLAQPACVCFGVSPLSTCRISSMIWLRITSNSFLAHHPILLNLLSMISSLAWPSQAPARSLLDHSWRCCSLREQLDADGIALAVSIGEAVSEMRYRFCYPEESPRGKLLEIAYRKRIRNNTDCPTTLLFPRRSICGEL